MSVYDRLFRGTVVKDHGAIESLEDYGHDRCLKYTTEDGFVFYADPVLDRLFEGEIVRSSTAHWAAD